MVKSFVKNKLRTPSIDRYPGIFRPSSSPFLTGDSLRNLCDHVFDETQSFKPLEVKENDIVFLKTDLKEIYFNHLLLLISQFLLNEICYTFLC